MLTKKGFLTFIFSLTCLAAFCQRPNYTEAQAQLKKAQLLLDSISKANPDLQKIMKANNVKLPDLNKTSQTLEKNVQTLNKINSNYSKSNSKGLPQKSSSAFSVSKTNKNEILTWASDMYDKSKIKAGAVIQPFLENTFSDTSLNPASAGMLLVATGLPKCAGQYLVCKYLLAHPQSASTLNDFGIFLRIDKEYKKAIAVFLYAKSLNDTSLEIATNLAWSYAYAGSFSEAKKYFNAILKVNPKYGSAMEGVSLIAYQEGDMNTFWKGLTQQLFNNSKSNGLGLSAPSNQMGSFCDAVLTSDEMNRLAGGEGDKAAQSAFNNMPPANPDAQSDEINVTGDEDIDYPSYAVDFPENMETITPSGCSGFQNKYLQAKQKDLNYITSLLSTLPKPKQFVNEDGELETIYDYSNDSHYKFFYKIHQQFEKRSTAIFASSSPKIERAIAATISSWTGEMNAYGVALSHCKDDECMRSVLCDYVPRLCGILRNFGMSIGDIVTKGFKRMDDETDWYINASSPMLQFIGEPNWNKYLNAVREVDIRALKLNLMNEYQYAMKVAAGFVVYAKDLANALKVSCVFELRIIQQKIQSKHKDLKTLAPPCNGSYANSSGNSKNLLNPRATKVDLGPAHFESDCSHEKFVLDEGKLGTSLNIGPVKGGAEISSSQFWETVHSKFVEDDYTRTGFEFHAKASIGVSKSITGAVGDVNITGAGGVKAEAEATVDFFKQFDQKGNLTKQGVAFDATAKVSGSMGAAGDILGIEDSKTDIMKNGFQNGMHASGEIWAVVGPDGQLGDYQYGKMKIENINK